MSDIEDRYVSETYRTQLVSVTGQEINQLNAEAFVFFVCKIITYLAFSKQINITYYVNIYNKVTSSMSAVETGSFLIIIIIIMNASRLYINLIQHNFFILIN